MDFRHIDLFEEEEEHDPKKNKERRRDLKYSTRIKTLKKPSFLRRAVSFELCGR